MGSYLVFRLGGTLYGVDALVAQEVVLLPALTAQPNAPPAIAGIIDLRGRAASVLDARVRLGLPPRRYALTDVVIVLAWRQGLAGLIADEVLDVCESADGDIEVVSGLLSDPRQERFVRGIARIDESLMLLLDLERLFDLGEDLPTGDSTITPEDIAAASGGWAEVGPEDLAVFAERAAALRRVAESDTGAEDSPLAVVGIGGECFGVAPAALLEFREVGEVTPVPCCPPHIVGVLNLRGEVLTLVDVRGALSMPLPDAPRGRVMVAQHDAGRLGVMVDEVLDIVHLPPSEVQGLPAAAGGSRDRYLTGTAHWNGRLVSLLALPQLLADDRWIVDQAT